VAPRQTSPIAGIVVIRKYRAMSETAAFISELIRAANEVPKLTMAERARLLQRAAATIRDYRDEINYSETPANDENQEDVVYFLNEAACFVDDFSDTEFAETILEAIAVIQAAQILLEEKRKVESGE
jgi:acyl-CoA reductase-like NAD-dependent aldehyde dehydrogenase